MLFDYDDRFEGILPKHAFPIPVGRYHVPKKFPKWWGALLDLAERYFRLTPEELEAGKGTIPRRLYQVRPKNPLLEAVHAGLIVKMQFYADWSLMGTPVNFPIEPLLENTLSRGLKMLDIARSQDWAVLVVEEFARQLHTYRQTCDCYQIRRTGSDIGVGKRVWFSPEDVEAFFRTLSNPDANSRTGLYGLVDLKHLHRVLLAEATEHDPQT